MLASPCRSWIAAWVQKLGICFLIEITVLKYAGSVLDCDQNDYCRISLPVHKMPIKGRVPFAFKDMYLSLCLQLCSG